MVSTNEGAGGWEAKGVLDCLGLPFPTVLPPLIRPTPTIPVIVSTPIPFVGHLLSHVPIYSLLHVTLNDVIISTHNSENRPVVKKRAT
jgi:hypothetical protein